MHPTGRQIPDEEPEEWSEIATASLRSSLQHTFSLPADVEAAHLLHYCDSFFGKDSEEHCSIDACREGGAGPHLASKCPGLDWNLSNGSIRWLQYGLFEWILSKSLVARRSLPVSVVFVQGRKWFQHGALSHPNKIEWKRFGQR